MYPSKEDKFYGIFVRNFIENFNNSKIQVVALSIIQGRGRNTINKLKKYFQFYISILINILKFNYDLIYVHYPSYASLPLLMVLPLIRKPLILNFHGSDAVSSTKLSTFLNFLLKPLIQRSSAVVVPSPYFKKIIADQFKINPSKIFVSPSGGIDTSQFRQLDINKNNASFTLGYVGRIDKGKGWQILLLACELLKKNIPEIKCLIAGNGLEFEEMKEMVKDLELSDFITILGAVPHHKLPPLFNQFDLFAFPTTRKAESLGLVGIEALSCGIPVVGSRLGGLQDYIIDDKNGKLFEPGNAEELANTILKLYENKHGLQMMKDKSRSTVKMYDKHFVSKELENKIFEITK